MMIIHGGRDYRIDVAQGLSAFTALQRQGTPSKFLYLPNEVRCSATAQQCVEHRPSRTLTQPLLCLLAVSRRTKCSTPSIRWNGTRKCWAGSGSGHKLQQCSKTQAANAPPVLAIAQRAVARFSLSLFLFSFLSRAHRAHASLTIQSFV